MEPRQLSVDDLPAPDDALAALCGRLRDGSPTALPELWEPTIGDLVRRSQGPPVGPKGHFAGFVDALVGPLGRRGTDLRGASARLEALPRDPAVEPFMSRVASGTGRLDRLLTALTEYAEAGREPQRQRVEPGRLVATALGAIDVPIDRQRLVIDVGGPAVWGDPEQLCLLMRQLLTNTISHGAAAETGVGVRTAHHGRHWVVRVVDHGVGIPKADRRRVLQPLVRLDRDRATPGDGLGLAICQRVALTHGGSVSVDRTPGGGAAVRVMWL